MNTFIAVWIISQIIGEFIQLENLSFEINTQENSRECLQIVSI